MIDITNYLWEQFPQRFADEDTYKDVNNQGLLERFISIFGIELQQEVINKLETRTDELDPDTAADEYLSEIAFALGKPEDLLGDTDLYRTILVTILKIYRIKGTIPSYKMLFNLFGLSVQITEFFPRPNKYDIGTKYDDKTVDSLPYDEGENNVGYIDYSITYSNLPGYNRAPFNPDLENRFKQMVINTLQPIDCRLRSFNYIAAEQPDGFPYPIPVILS